MRVAILLSGRVKKYNNFLKLLKEYVNKYEIHVFISVNDTWSEFYDILKRQFGDLLKDIHVEPYIIHSDFSNNKYLRTHVLPQMTYNTYMMTYNTLSMLYNDQKCFSMVEKYSEENNIQYDIYVRTRSDIIHTSFPFVDYFCNLDKNILYCINPLNKFTLAITDNPNDEYRNGRFHVYGNTQYNGKFVTNDISFGNKDNMNIFCNAYNYYLEMNKKENGNIFIIYENAVTVYLLDIGVNWSFFEFDYQYELNRDVPELY
jgi:hypothetical protein